MRLIQMTLISLSCAALIASCGSDSSGDGGGAGGDDGGGGAAGGGADGGGAAGGGGEAGNVNPGAKATGEAGCEEAVECAGNVCVAIIDGDHPPVYCTQECGTCKAGMYCDDSTFGLIGLSFCRFSNEPAGAEPETPPQPAEPPRLPCKEDADCEGTQVCATLNGKTDCTIPCTVEEDCTPPAVAGVTLDLATCGKEEGQDRSVCLPDLACWNPDPITAGCISGMPGADVGGGDLGGDLGGAIGGGAVGG